MIFWYFVSVRRKKLVIKNSINKFLNHYSQSKRSKFRFSFITPLTFKSICNFKIILRKNILKLTDKIINHFIQCTLVIQLLLKCNSKFSLYGTFNKKERHVLKGRKKQDKLLPSQLSYNRAHKKEWTFTLWKKKKEIFSKRYEASHSNFNSNFLNYMIFF